MNRKINYFLFFFFTYACSVGCHKEQLEKKVNSAIDQYAIKRIQMVEQQIEKRGVKDKLVINAMKKVERHKFVPENMVQLAYVDSPLPIEDGQTISQPYIVAFMTQSLQLKGNEKILEIGTGSGYQAAVLSEIVAEVFTIEIIPELARSAIKKFEKLGYKNIHVKIGDGYFGWPEKSLFDGIIVTAAPRKIPELLIKQLKPGGRMIIPVGKNYQELIVITKQPDGSIKKQSVMAVRFVPMTGEIDR